MSKLYPAPLSDEQVTICHDKLRNEVYIPVSLATHSFWYFVFYTEVRVQLWYKMVLNFTPLILYSLPH